VAASRAPRITPTSNAAERQDLVTVEDYLALEAAADAKHEYLGGVVHAMAGATFQHSVIASNVLGLLVAQLRGKSCRALSSDFKIRIKLGTQSRFYYPDASVVCTPVSPGDVFHDDPVVVVEVLSPSTRRIDLGEKKDAYLSIPSLLAYIVIEQESPAVIVFRRVENRFVREVCARLESTISLAEIDATLPLDQVFDSAEFPPERSE
jgi:Uma2 family endonuclease